MANKIKGDSQAQQLMQQALSRAGTGAKAAAERVLAQAAGADGNRWLDAAEAKRVADAFEAKSGGTRKLTKAEIEEIGKGIAADAAQRKGALNLDGLTSSFTSEKTDLESKILNGIRDSVAQAAGRHVDVDVMIYQFQSKAIADELIALCKANPNLDVRVIADFSQTSEAGNNQVPRLGLLSEKPAAQGGIPNLHIRYKKDAPYTWDAKDKRPVYSHASTQGLNHHKGFVASIEGRPVKGMFGSFNWSKTANTSNYEDLLEVDATKSSAALSMAQQYREEFRGLFDHTDSLTQAQATHFKRTLFDDLKRANGVAPGDYRQPSAATLAPGAKYGAFDATGGWDVNSLRSQDLNGLTGLLGATALGKVQAELAANGRFEDANELFVRVPSLASLAEPAKARIRQLAFGDGQVSINEAQADELVRAGLTTREADAVVAARSSAGTFESLAELTTRVPGFTAARLAKLEPRLSATGLDAFFSARPFGQAWQGPGFAESNRTATLPVRQADGTTAKAEATVAQAVVDLFRRAQPGQTILVSMYGISLGTPEWNALVEAANRGVGIKVLLNEGYNDPAAKALVDLMKAGKSNVDARMQTAKTMHTKFGVVGDDVFTGSANFSGSASTKHAEDRFLLRNQPEMAAAYSAEFERVWAKSKVLS